MLNIYNANNHNNPTGKDLAAVKGGARKSGFEKYQDPTGEFPGWELKFGFWYAKNRLLLYKLLVGFLVVFSAVTILFGLWQWGSYLIFGLTDDALLRKNLSSPVDYTVIHPRYSPAPLQILDTQILPGGVNKSDLVTEVVNPNERFVAEFDFYFVVGENKTPVARALLLPGEGRPVATLGFEGALPGADFVLENVVWLRISNHRVADTKAWQEERLNFMVSDFSFTRAGGLPEAPTAHAIRFKLANDSAYSFVQPSFYAGLLEGETLVGILPLKLDELKSRETKEIDLRSFTENLSVDGVKIFPLINIYDRGVYLAPER